MGTGTGIGARSRLGIGVAVAGIVLAGAGRQAHAEINIGDSVEWLVAKADRIAVAKVVSVHGPDPAAQGKSRGLVLMTVEIAETLKGGRAAAPGERMCVGARDLAAKDLEAYRRSGAALLLLLERTVQATSFEGRVCDHWPLRATGDSRPLLVPLDAPGTRLLAATGFRVLEDREAILSTCRDVLRRLASANAGARPNPPPRQWLLEVPPGTEAHRVLYAGSTCFLYVPDSLFPKARPSLH